MEEESKGFVVKDRRIFDETGTAREAPVEPERKPEEKPERENQFQKTAADEDPYEESLPEMNFSNFVISLSTSALYHFGDFPDPATKQGKKNLPAVKQIIDTLSMLQIKTRGNLDGGERNLIESALFELRMRYVKEKT